MFLDEPTGGVDPLSRRRFWRLIEDLAASPEGMIGDLHGTPAYRAHLTGVLTRRAVAAA